MDQEDQQKWKGRIREFAKGAGFSALGFTDSKPIGGLEQFLIQRRDAGYHTSFEEKELIRRVDPKMIWPSCQTVIAMAYPLPLTADPQENGGVLARSAVGEDYHKVVIKALQDLIRKMEENGWQYEKPHIQVDMGALNERAFALKAGLGWIGRNQQLIVPGVGSFVALALMFLDQALPPDPPLENGCGSCKKCVEACPASILGQGQFIANQCLSYLTQSKEPLSQEQVSRMGNRIFGCDTCQEACPHNQPWLRREKSVTQAVSRGLDLWETLNLTKGQFNQGLKPTAAGWRGKGILQRNAYFALKKLNDPRLEAWAKEQYKKGLMPPIIQPYFEEQD